MAYIRWFISNFEHLNGSSGVLLGLMSGLLVVALHSLNSFLNNLFKRTAKELDPSLIERILFTTAITPKTCVMELIVFCVFIVVALIYRQNIRQSPNLAIILLLIFLLAFWISWRIIIWSSFKDKGIREKQHSEEPRPPVQN